MGELTIWVPVFIVSLLILVKAADYFIESAEKMGDALGIHPFIVGVTIVASGTSLPELVTSLVAVFENETSIVVGNAVGSNIANFGLVMAFIAIITRRLDLKFNVLLVEIPFFIGSAILVSIMMLDGKFGLFDGIISCLGLAIFLIYTIRDSRKEEDLEGQKSSKFPLASLFVFILSGVVISFAAKYNIKSVINIADIIGIGSEVIALTAVALGTSLPELFVSIAAARRKNIEIAVGNLIGSNIFNSFAVLGIPAIVNYFVNANKPPFGSEGPWLIVTDNILNFSIPVMLAISFIFFLMMITNKVNRWQGWLLLLCYVFFIGNIIILAI